MQNTRPNTRLRFLPIFEAKPGMVLSAPIELSQNGYLTLSMPTGLEITEEVIQQLKRHQAEYIFISEPDLRTPEAIANDAAMSAKRTLEIFSQADLKEPVMAAFFDQVLQYRSA
ncbi:MAG: hypothetical protein PHI29_12165 [Gallionella sp.]|nr:hypothetical protein [Gallionella sp.]